jgi:muconolactone delta-isomerase
MCKRQLNTYQVLGNIVLIFTRKGERILVDLDDFPLVADFNWYLSKGYAYAYDNTQQKIISMHRLLMNPPDFLEVDHINHHPWDNRRSNLRITTTAQNQSNSKLRIDNTSGYKGVTFNKRQRKWKAHIRVDGEKKHLGLFSTIEEAILARQLAEIKYHGWINASQQALSLNPNQPQ